MCVDNPATRLPCLESTVRCDACVCCQDPRGAVPTSADDLLRAVPQATFEAWQRRPSALTGWFPRGIAPRRGCRGYDYLSRDRSVLLRGAYSMVLTKVRLCTLAMLSPC